MTYIEWSDVARTFSGVVCLLLVSLFLRLFVVRARRDGFGTGVSPHPLTSIGLAAVFVFSALRRRQGLGEPGDIFLWGPLVATTIVAVGMVMAIEWHGPLDRWRKRGRLRRKTNRQDRHDARNESSRTR